MDFKLKLISPGDPGHSDRCVHVHVRAPTEQVCHNKCDFVPESFTIGQSELLGITLTPQPGGRDKPRRTDATSSWRNMQARECYLCSSTRADL